MVDQKREREAEWRKEKLVYYQNLVESLSNIIKGDDSPEGHKAFANATNNLLLFAPESVIDALNNFRLEICISNKKRTQERHDQLLAILFFEIRCDIGVSSKKNNKLVNFRPILWASGVDEVN